MTGRRSHGRLSALNGVVHQGRHQPDSLKLTPLAAADMLQLVRFPLGTPHWLEGR